MKVRRARIYDAAALLTVIIVISLDQWTKSLVIQHLSPPDNGQTVPLIGDYLTLYYIQNRGAAFSLFTGNFILAILIVVAIGVIAYLYLRMLNSGPLLYKLIFGLIIGGALGNLIDRIRHSGYVVDFIFFRIPQINFRFAIFNLADAAISIGVISLFLFILFSGFGRDEKKPTQQAEGRVDATRQQNIAPMRQSGSLHSPEQDAQS